MPLNKKTFSKALELATNFLEICALELIVLSLSFRL